MGSFLKVHCSAAAAIFALLCCAPLSFCSLMVCSVPSLDTACGGMEMTLANCSLSSSLVISLPSLAQGLPLCNNIAIRLTNISFVATEGPLNNAVLSFEVVNGSYHNVTVRVEQSFVRGTVAAWSATSSFEVANVSLTILDTLVEDGRGLVIAGALQYSDKIELFLRNVLWRFTTAGNVSRAILAIDGQIYNTTKVNQMNLFVTLDKVHVNTTQSVVVGNENAEILIVTSAFLNQSTISVTVADSSFWWLVSMATATMASTTMMSYTNLMHLRVSEVGIIRLICRNVTMEVVHLNSSSAVVHEAALLTFHSVWSEIRAQTLAHLVKSIVLCGNISVVVEGQCRLHLEASGRSSMLASTSLRSLTGVYVTVHATNSELEFFNNGNVSTLSWNMVRGISPPGNVAYSRQSSIVELPLAEYLDHVQISITGCSVSLVVVVDSVPFARAPLYDDSVGSFQTNGVIVSNASNIAVTITNSSVSGGIFRRALLVPYVTIGCTHAVSVVAVVGSPVQCVKILIVNVTVNMTDNVTYTPQTSLFAALLAGVGSVSITMAILSMSASLNNRSSSNFHDIVCRDVAAYFDVTSISYFTDGSSRGGVVVSGILVTPLAYFPRRRGVLPILVASVLSTLGELSLRSSWSCVTVSLANVALTFAPLGRQADREHISNISSVDSSVFSFSSGLLTGGVNLDHIEFSAAGFNPGGFVAGYGSVNNMFRVPSPSPCAQIWLHLSGEWITNTTVIVGNYSLLDMPKFSFVNTSILFSIISMFSATTITSPSLPQCGACLTDAVNTTVEDSAWVVSNTQFTAGSGGVLFGSGISWGKNATVGLVCGTTWNGLPLRSRTINVPMVVLKTSEARRRQGLLLPPRAVGCPQPEAQVMYSYSATAEATATHAITQTFNSPLHVSNPNPGKRDPLQGSAIVLSLAFAFLPSVATVVPGMQAMSRLSLARRMCTATLVDLAAPPLSDTTSNPLGVGIASLGDELMFAGGSVVSSIVFWVIYVVVALCGLTVRSPLKIFTTTSLVGTMLKLPGSLYAPALLVLQPLVTAAVVLLASSARSAGSIAFGVAVLAAMVVPLCLLTRNIFRGDRLLTWTADATQVAEAHRRWRAYRLLSEFFHDRFECLPRDASSQWYFDRYSSVASSFVGNRQLFVAVEIGYAMVSGIVCGLSVGLDPVVACNNATLGWLDWIQAALCVALLLTVLVLRPYSSPSGNMLSVIGSLLSALGIAMQYSMAPQSSEAAVATLTWIQVVLGFLPLFGFALRQCTTRRAFGKNFPSVKSATSLEERFFNPSSSERCRGSLQSSHDNLELLVRCICQARRSK